MRHATSPAFALYHAYTVLAMMVNELHVFLSSQPWNKKENARSKGSESGKRVILLLLSPAPYTRVLQRERAAPSIALAMKQHDAPLEKFNMSI